MTTATTHPLATYAKTVSAAFAKFQATVNTDAEELTEARRRRDQFDAAFCGLDVVGDVFCSGSLARKTHKDPIHDVDTVVIYRPETRPTWGIAGNGSAQAALDEAAASALRLLGVGGGSEAQELVSAEPRNHAVECTFAQLRGHSFTVDVMPALPCEDGSEKIRVPVAREDRWGLVDPRFFIHVTSKRQARWSDYVPTVRILKFWKDVRRIDNHALDATSLFIEVLAYEVLSHGAQPEALAMFFTQAQRRLAGPVLEDPAHLCGPIQGDINLSALMVELKRAATLATRAVQAAQRGDEFGAVAAWHELFGDSFPKPQPRVSLGGAAPSAVSTVPSSTAAAPRRLRDEPQG